jgi:hypothetical protein
MLRTVAMSANHSSEVKGFRKRDVPGELSTWNEG